MIVFTNPGIIDLDAALTMGVSVKEGDSLIGYFGTGLKFAIATILRNGGSVVMWRGQDRHEFTAERRTIRGEDFDLVMMDGERLGFSTQLGRNWEPWMAFRELASNCRDEGGKYFLSPATGPICADHAEGRTIFCVEGMDDIWPERSTILLEGEPGARTAEIEIHDRPSRHAFYRGVRIYTPPYHFGFTYNIIGDLDLTEDRTAKHPYQIEKHICQAIGELSDAGLIRRILTQPEQHIESRFDLECWGHSQAECSETFREAARDLVMGRENVVGINESVRDMVRKWQFKEAPASQAVQLPSVRQAMLDRATKMLTAAGYEIEKFPILYFESLGTGIIGTVNDGRIFLSSLAFEGGTRLVAHALLEEYAHLVSGCGDFTRGFQNWLFDRLLMQVEETAGEPF